MAKPPRLAAGAPGAARNSWNWGTGFFGSAFGWKRIGQDLFGQQ